MAAHFDSRERVRKERKLTSVVMKTISLDKRNKIIELHGQGLSNSAIASQLGNMWLLNRHQQKNCIQIQTAVYLNGQC